MAIPDFDRMAADVVSACMRAVGRVLKPELARITALEKENAERAHQVQRHAEHLQRLQTRETALQARIDILERK